VSRASAAEDEVMRLKSELDGLYGELKHRDEAVKYAIEQVQLAPKAALESLTRAVEGICRAGYEASEPKFLRYLRGKNKGKEERIPAKPQND
jgi:hypothetical protein